MIPYPPLTPWIRIWAQDPLDTLSFHSAEMSNVFHHSRSRVQHLTTNAAGAIPPTTPAVVLFGSIERYPVCGEAAVNGLAYNPEMQGQGHNVRPVMRPSNSRSVHLPTASSVRRFEGIFADFAQFSMKRGL